MHRLIRLAICAVLLIGAAPAVAQQGAERAPATAEDVQTALRQLQLNIPNPLPSEACLPEEQAAADTLFRLHTELMQASLACAEHYEDPEIYAAYRAFTDRHVELIMDAQSTIIGYLNQKGEDGRALFDDYRTALANEEAQFMSGFPTDRYCRIRQSRFNSLIDASPKNVEGYVKEAAGRRFAACSAP